DQAVKGIPDRSGRRAGGDRAGRGGIAQHLRVERRVVTVRDFGADAHAGDVLRQTDAPKVDVALVDLVVDAAVRNRPRDERLRQLVREVAVVKTERAVEPRRAPARREAKISPLV